MSSIPLFDPSSLDNLPDFYYPIVFSGIQAGMPTEMSFDVSDLPSRWVHVFSENPLYANRGFGISDLNVYGMDSTTSKW